MIEYRVIKKDLKVLSKMGEDNRQMCGMDNDYMIFSKYINKKIPLKELEDNNKPTKVKTFEENSFEYIISKYFLDKHIEEKTPSILYQIKNNNSEHIIQKWADDIRKLKQIDGFTEEQIKYIIDYTLGNNFWKYQILSITKFRKKNKEGTSYFVNMINEVKKEKTNLKPKNKIGTLL